jgi:hypothetical protein
VLLSTKYLNLKHSKKSRKLLLKWIGPFEVVQVVGPVAYKLKSNLGWRVHPVFHDSLLEPCRESGRVVTVGRDIAARRLTMCENHGFALQLAYGIAC